MDSLPAEIVAICHREQHTVRVWTKTFQSYKSHCRTVGLWVITTIHNQDVFVRRIFVVRMKESKLETKYGRVEARFL